MKDLKNKDIILGLVVLIILCVVAISLIIKREFPQNETAKEQISIDLEDAQVEQKAQQNGLNAESEALQKAEDTLLIQKDELEKSKKEIENVQKEVEHMQALALETYADSLGEFHTEPVYLEYTGDEMEQLEELYYYWNEYKLDAVDDLIRLPRIRTAFTNELAGTNRFYYYGDVNSDGLPSGSGLAVYENNAYYCGEWKNGKRHGNGMWLQIYPDKPSTINDVTGVIEHSYNGEWANDFPNGKGQEHISYDFEEMTGENMITNVIGTFKDGYYDKELYIMTVDDENNSTDWEAVAQKGTFSYYHKRYNASGELPVWKKMINADEDEYRWLDESGNVNWGIFGLKKMH